MLSFIKKALLILTSLLISSLFLALPVSANELTVRELEEGIINHRGISSRCEELNKQRSQMLNQRDRYTTLISRSDRLLNLSPEDNKQTNRELRDMRMRLDQEVYLLNQRIINREEDIVRAGCPTIRF